MTKKQVFKIIIFILAILWLIPHLTYCIRTNGDVKDRFVGFYAEKRNTIDAVVIGSSPVPYCISTPKIYGDMGITMYPLSSNMQRPVATKYLVEETLKTQDPDLFIFEMKMWQAEDEALINADKEKNMGHTREITDNMKYSLNRIRAINAMVKPENAEYDEEGKMKEDYKRFNFYFDICKHHSNWKTLAMWSQLRTFFYAYPDDLKGFVVSDEVEPAEKENFHSVTDIEKMPAEQEEYLDDLIACLKKHNKDALFIITPYAVSEEEQKKINYIRDHVTERGYNFLDMNQHLDEMGFDETTDYKDGGTHTNIMGADKVTAWFEDYLTENYVKTGILGKNDRSSGAKYDSWKRSYDLWLKELEGIQ
ncbi:MAG: SGNH/GDSL hydrolase family protein [Butyrivibrio sp.]|nr:SGNH/GDSL hydrolase family protein [Butyrivibrio sp.]